MIIKHIKHHYVFILVLLFLTISPVLAATYPPNFSPVIEYNNTQNIYGLPSAEYVHYNISFVRDDNVSTPFIFWLFMAVTGLALLIASFILTPERGSELVALIAPYPLLATAWQSLAIDTMNGYGVTSNTVWIGDGSPISQTDIIPNINEYVLLENHVIHTEVLLAILFLILFITSLLNIYRLYLNSKTIKRDNDKSTMRRI